MPGANEDRQNLVDAERAAAEVISFNDLGADALRAIQGAVGASNALLYRYDEQGIVHGLSGSLSSAIPTYAAELFPTDPVQHYLMQVNPEERSIITIEDLDPRAYQRSAAYNEFYHPHDVHHLLGLWLTTLPYGAPGMTGILFTRAATESGFSERESRALSHALPSFRAAIRRVDRIERTDRERRAIEGVVSAVAPGAYMALDGAGRLLWMSPEAEALLEPHTARGRVVPPILSDAAAKIGALGSGNLPETPPPFWINVPAPGGSIAAELRLGRAASGEPIVAVTLSARPVPTLDAIAERYKLTRAERAVLGCLGEGLSNREIAARLFVSVETIKTHVQRVLGKLEVASRTQAAVKVAGG